MAPDPASRLFPKRPPAFLPGPSKYIEWQTWRWAAPVCSRHGCAAHTGSLSLHSYLLLFPVTELLLCANNLPIGANNLPDRFFSLFYLSFTSLNFKSNELMKECIMSFFNAPISNQVPSGVTSVKQLHTYITSNEWLKERTLSVQVALSDEKRFRKLKQNLLPYVTPAGVFSYRKEDRLLFLSGEFVIDIDHLPSPEETLHWRDTLFADNKLRPDLAFVSPSTTGVKLLVPYRLSPKASIEESFDKARLSAWEYLKWKYGLNADASNADLSRACFLCHDPSAKLRES